ncbi:MAG: hypothetical protein KA160_08040 [Lacibacter sp.]|nr:hypothetical protein [Lacibacter sp.]
MKKITCIALLFLLSTSLSAQVNVSVGGNKVTIGNKKKPVNTDTNRQQGSNSNEENQTKISKNKVLWKRLNGSSMRNDWVSRSEAIDEIMQPNAYVNDKRNGLLSPYFSIQKAGESNNQKRFAVDYPELKQYFQQPDKLGKIYFSTEQGKASLTNNTSNFTTADMIYATLEINGAGLSQTFQMPKTANAFGKEEELYSVKLGIQLFDVTTGDFIGGSSYLYSGDKLLLYNNELNVQKLHFDLRPAPGNTRSIFGESINWTSIAKRGGILLEHLNNHLKKEGNYRVVICISNIEVLKDGFGNAIKNQWNEAYGEFTFTVYEADLAKMKSDAKLIEKKVYEIVHTAVLPEAFTKQASSPDPSLQLSFLKMLVQNTYGHMYIIHKVVFDNGNGTGWRVETNSLGIPIEKRLNRQVLFTYTSKADGKCYAEGFVPRRKYVGGGKYEALSMSSSRFEKIIIDCKQAK